MYQMSASYVTSENRYINETGGFRPLLVFIKLSMFFHYGLNFYQFMPINSCVLKIDESMCKNCLIPSFLFDIIEK